jgi:hypothetical protein
VTFLLPGGLGQLGAPSSVAWDPLTTGWSTPPGLVRVEPAIPAGEPGTVGGMSIAPLLAPTVITENFPTVENPLSSGGQWMHQTTYWANMAVVNWPPHICYSLQDGTNLYGDGYSYLSPLVWPPSHTDVMVAYTVNKAPNAGNIDEWEAVFRVSDSPLPGGVGTVKLYEVNYNSDGAYTQFVAWDGTPGTFTIINNGPGVVPALVTGDVISVTFQGLTHTLKRNGTTIWTATDPGTGGGDPNYTGPFLTGQPGFGKFFQGTAGTGNKMGVTQVVVTSAPYTAPTPLALLANVSSLSTAGTIVGQIPCQHNPTSWSVSGATPPGSTGYFAIDSFGNVVVQAAAVGNIIAAEYDFIATATNTFGSNTALVKLTNVGVTGPQFSNGNRTIIDGDNSHGTALAVRGTKSVLTTGTAASRRRYFEVKLGNVGETPAAIGFCSAGVVIPAWNAVTTTALPLGYDAAGNSIGVNANPGGAYVLVFQASGVYATILAPIGGDILGIAVDNSGVNNPFGTALWFNINGNWLNRGAGTTTVFPGLANPDYVLSGGPFQVWPACSTDYQDHVTIHPNSTPLYIPAGFLAL